MTNIFDLQPQYTPEYVQQALSEWERATFRWNVYRDLRKNKEMGRWRAVAKIAEMEGCTNQNIIYSIDRVKKQILIEHPELSEKEGDHYTNV